MKLVSPPRIGEARAHRSAVNAHLGAEPIAMRARLLLFLNALPFLTTFTALHAQGPDLVGYWHNWNDGNAPYLELSQVDPRYTVIEVSFAVPAAGSTHDMVFAPCSAPCVDRFSFGGPCAPKPPAPPRDGGGSPAPRAHWTAPGCPTPSSAGR